MDNLVGGGAVTTFLPGLPSGEDTEVIRDKLKLDGGYLSEVRSKGTQSPAQEGCYSQGS